MYTAIITDKTTGLTATKKFSEDWDWGTDFAWSEGNYSCDCNRGIFFGVDSECGNERFTVKIIEEDKIMYYEEDAE